MRPIRFCAAVLTVLLSLASAVPARADNLSQARAAYKIASQHFKLGEFQAALDGFKEVYRLHEDPTFLFNIGQCQRQLGQRADAVTSFRTYLVEAKHPANRDEVEAIITQLRGEIAAEEAKQRDEAAAAAAAAAASAAAAQAAQSVTPTLVVDAPPPPRKTPVYKKWWLWTTVGVVVAVGIGVGLGVGLTRSEYPHASGSDGSFHF
jgi:tetratricopeptide (TPR) repeat protein